jgi:hypothetical protein
MPMETPSCVERLSVRDLGATVDTDLPEHRTESK